MKPIIEVKNLSKKYTVGERQQYLTLRDSIGGLFKKPFTKPNTKLQENEFWALKDVSFKIEPGEVVGIIGRNGAGKSTLLKILSRITPPTKGEVTLRGRVGSLLEVGTGFHQELTGRENIFLNGAILGMSQKEIRKKFDEIVDFAEVEKFIDTPVKHYSSGMYMRLAFAVAAHLDPEILIVDEVLAVGDSRFQKKCLTKMNSISENEGKTVLFVSHNLTAIKSLCSKAMLLEKGKIGNWGQAEQVIENYYSQLPADGILKLESHLVFENSSIKITKVYVSSSEKRQVKKITTDTPFLINIDYEITKSGSLINFNAIFKDTEDNCLFGSISHNDVNWYNKPMPKGKYTSTVSIPGNLLNDRKYRIDLLVLGSNYNIIVNLSNVITLNVKDGVTVRKEFYGKYEGFLRPNFIWKTVKYSDKNIVSQKNN